MMKRASLVAAALAATACASAPTFNIPALQPTAETDQVSLTGRFELSGLQFRLYPGSGPACLSGALSSLAGVPPPEYTNRQMTLTGYLYKSGSEAAGEIVDACDTGIVMLANEVVVP